MSRGTLIVIEGLDGSGKATQAKLLFESLRQQGKNVRQVSFPDYDSDSSALVKMYLAGDFGSDPGDVNAYAASTFFAHSGSSFTASAAACQYPSARSKNAVGMFVLVTGS